MGPDEALPLHRVSDVDFFFVPATHLYPVDHLRPYADTPIVMVEDLSAWRRRHYHQQKIALVIAAMRNFHAELVRLGFDVRYYHFDAGQTINSAIAQSAHALGARRFATFFVNDHALRARLHRISRGAGPDWVELDDPGFLTPASSLPDGRRLPRMEAFYRKQRQRLGVLVDAAGKPTGGAWSFDKENRRKITKRQAIPRHPEVAHNDITRQAIQQVSAKFADHPGNASELWLPADHASANAWLEAFVQERLIGFGTYEDAMTARSDLLFHSGLSPLMNIGLVTPRDVIDQALSKSGVPINDIEGFIRQVIGWREFIRSAYHTGEHVGPLQNKRGHNRQFTNHWLEGTTGLPPLDQAIQTLMRRGWNHHIERLMVFGNLMNLCEIDPQAVYEYFMTHHIDAYDWVMRPNIEGMGLTSSAQSFATKPYICGSNYLLKMSDYARGDWCDVVDGLYWRFVQIHRAEFASNARTALVAKGLDRIAPDRRERIFSSADQFLARCTAPAGSPLASRQHRSTVSA